MHLREAIQDKALLDRLKNLAKLPHFVTAWMETDIKSDAHAEGMEFSGNFKVSRLHEFKNSEDPLNFFSRAERSLLTDYVLMRTHYGPKDSQRGYKKLIANGAFAAAFPLHDGPYEVSWHWHRAVVPGHLIKYTPEWVVRVCYFWSISFTAPVCSSPLDLPDDVLAKPHHLGISFLSSAKWAQTAPTLTTACRTTNACCCTKTGASSTAGTSFNPTT